MGNPVSFEGPGFLLFAFRVFSVGGVAGFLFGGEVGGVEAGVGDVVDFAKDDIRHVSGAALDVVGIFTGKMLIDGGFEKGEPVIEFVFPEIGQGEELGMGGDGVALVAAAAEEDGFPEGVHFWEVGVPVDLGELIEDEAELVVFADGIIERIDEKFDAVAIDEIGSWRLGIHGLEVGRRGHLRFGAGS